MSPEAPERTLLAVVSDLLIEVRIQAAAQQQRLTVTTASAEEAAALIAAAGPVLVVTDLAVTRDRIGELQAAARKEDVEIVAYYPHVDSALRTAALAAGVEHIYPRSRFLRDLPKILAARLSR